MSRTFVLYAPNVHTGGGFVLLRALLGAWPEAVPLTAFLDGRARDRLLLPSGAKVSWVAAKVGPRVKAQFGLRLAAGAGSTVLCFHGLPPVLPSSARVVVFQQNRNHFGLNPLSDFAPRTAIRLAFERLISRLFRHRVTEYVVQTPTMARALAQWYSNGNRAVRPPAIRVLPFMDALPSRPASEPVASEWDFVYVSDGVAHKNHRRLLEAWRELAKQGLKPRLALTLGPRDAALAQAVVAFRAECGAEVHNLGQMPHEQVLDLYRRSRALIFPSLSESFGLPLIEAQSMGLPILAPEMDYVRDVCEPAQTFDPQSPQSIARAVKRFLGEPEPIVKLHSPGDFWAILLGNLAQQLSSAGPDKSSPAPQ